MVSFVRFFCFLSIWIAQFSIAQELTLSVSGSLDPEFSRINVTTTVSNIPNEQLAPTASNLLNRQIELFFTGVSKTKPVLINKLGISSTHVISATWSPTAQTRAEASSGLSSLTVTGTIIPIDTWSDFSNLAAGGESIPMAAVFVPYETSTGALSSIVGVSLDLHDFTVPINWNKPVSAPDITNLKPIHRGFFMKWATPDNITYSNVTVSSDDETDDTASVELGSQEDVFPDEVLAVSFRLDDAPAAFLGISFDPAEPKTGNEISCTYLAPPTDMTDAELMNTGWSCVDCTSDTSASHAYLPYRETGIAYNMFELNSAASWSKTGLDINVPYVTFLQYPRGLNRTTCRLVTTTENFTISEINGGSAAVEADPRCFIATAAFGTPFSKELDTLRWFRDHYLQSSALGRELVELYYHHSPQLAQWVATAPAAQWIVRTALYPLIWLITLEQQYPGSSLILIIMAMGFVYIRRRHLHEHSS